MSKKIRTVLCTKIRLPLKVPCIHQIQMIIYPAITVEFYNPADLPHAYEFVNNDNQANNSMINNRDNENENWTDNKNLTNINQISNTFNYTVPTQNTSSISFNEQINTMNTQPPTNTYQAQPQNFYEQQISPQS